MRYSVSWLDDVANKSREERVTVADLQLWIAESNVTLHLDGDQVSDSIAISLYGLAEGIAHDWWRLFGARDYELSIVKYRSGYAMPDIRFSYDGSAFEAVALQRAYQNPDIRFWAGPHETLDRAAAEHFLDGIVGAVLDRLNGCGAKHTSAALRWARVLESRGHPEEASFCEAAGSLGVDPYSVSESCAELIERASTRFEGEQLNELLAGAVLSDQNRLLDWVEHVEDRPNYAARVADLRPSAVQAARDLPHHANERSWELGYRSARSMRRALNLGTKDRFRSYRPLAEKLGASKSYELAKPVDGLRALRSDKSDSTYIHMRTHGDSAEAKAAHLFSFARAVGDVACFPEQSRAPVNDLHSAYRQAAGRAFAAEFLAPIDEISAMKEDGHDVVSIADEFGVSTHVIERQLENEKRINALF